MVMIVTMTRETDICIAYRSFVTWIVNEEVTRYDVPSDSVNQSNPYCGQRLLIKTAFITFAVVR